LGLVITGQTPPPGAKRALAGSRAKVAARLLAWLISLLVRSARIFRIIA
jgi:hypothetical protein